MKPLTNAVIMNLVIASLCVAFYVVVAILLITDSKADTIKVGDGPFVLAVSYTESYKDLQYVANFGDCETAMTYFHAKCNTATIALFLLEDFMYMKLNHNPDITFRSFEFEVDDSQSCGFVKTQAGYSTFVEED